MPVVNGYCSDNELLEWNKADQPVDGGIRERAINASSRGIDQYCQRHFWQAASTPRLFAPDNAYEFDLGPFNDLHEITSLKTDAAGDGTFETTWAAGDYELLPINPLAGPEQRPWTSIRSTSTRPFPFLSNELGATGRTARVEITGKWGWAAVPEAVVQACLIQAARIFGRKETPHGVAGWGAFGEIRLGRSDPDVMALLEDYRLYPRVGFVRIR